MIVTLFGAKTPKEAGPEFRDDLKRIIQARPLHDGKSRTKVIVEFPWMASFLDITDLPAKSAVYSFEHVWSSVPYRNRWVAALNATDVAIFVIPKEIQENKDLSLNSPIIDCLVTAHALRRTIQSNVQPKDLAALIVDRLEESNRA
jgi:hypothetical protein